MAKSGASWPRVGEIPVERAQHFVLGTASLSIFGYERNLAEEAAILLRNAVSNKFSTQPHQRLVDKDQLRTERWRELGTNAGHSQPPVNPARRNPVTTYGQVRIKLHNKPVR